MTKWTSVQSNCFPSSAGQVPGLSGGTTGIAVSHKQKEPTKDKLLLFLVVHNQLIPL